MGGFDPPEIQLVTSPPRPFFVGDLPHSPSGTVPRHPERPWVALDNTTNAMLGIGISSCGRPMLGLKECRTNKNRQKKRLESLGGP